MLRRKKAPEIFDDPEDFAAAFQYTLKEPPTPQDDMAKSLLTDLAKECTTWDDFIARVEEARKGDEDATKLAALDYLEETAKRLKIEEGEDVPLSEGRP